ncbi:hypothetical protein [Aliiroseovarius sp. YM-037]|uniref:hypothetical protein n=1 Tax=Aliiroseovarius sp. YM-037 TaxID=3341728 RepID=UPI003A812AE3
MKLLGYFVAFGCLVCSPAVADITGKYECELRDGNSGGWVPTEIHFLLNGDGSAVVADPVSYHFTEAPVQTRYSQTRGGKIRVNWAINTQDVTAQRARMRYRAEIDSSSLAIYIRADPADYRANLSGRGNCRKVS